MQNCFKILTMGSHVEFVLVIFLPIVGFLIDRLLFYKLRSSDGWFRSVISSLKHMPTLWSFLVALHIFSEKIGLPQAYLNFKNRVTLAFLILSVSLLLSRLASNLITLYMKSYREDMPATSLVGQITRVVVLLLGSIIALDKVGIAVTPLITALGVGGLAVALAVRDTLENLFAGFHILATRQIKPGDYIKLQSGEEGFVEDITWRNTTIRQPANNLLIIPNSKLSTSIITNFSMPEPELNLTVPLSVSYENDLDKVEKLTLETAREVQREVDGAVPDFEPKLRFTGFGELSVSFNIILRARDVDSQNLLRHEFIKRIKRAYEREGIRMFYPNKCPEC
ncbi:MAG: mechanosensitive ion channel family protein [Aquificaceae bacterium]|nr:mechanosensitive ion channel family protein [Aquificaceae bacterium]